MYSMKRIKCHLKGKVCSKFANGMNFHDLKKNIDCKLMSIWSIVKLGYTGVYIFVLIMSQNIDNECFEQNY